MPTNASAARAAALRSRLAALSGEPLTFDLDNQRTGAGPIFYATTKKGYGRLLLTITNNSTNVIDLSSGSKLDIYFIGLLSDPQIMGITVNTAGWSGGPVNQGLGAYLALTCDGATSLKPGDAIPILIYKALASGAATTGYVTVKYSGFSPLAAGEGRITAYRQALPTGGAAWPLGFQWGARTLPYAGDNNTVYVTPWDTSAAPGIANELVLEISNTSLQALAWPSGASPSLVVAFTTGEDNLAICSDEQLKQTNASVATNGTSAWSVGPTAVGPTTVFTLTPNQGGQVLLAKGETLSVTFSNLVTTLAPNFPSGVSIQFAGLAAHGYDDGYQLESVDKTGPTPSLTASVACGGEAVVAGSTIAWGEVTVTWNAFAAQGCYVGGVQQGASGTYPFSPGGPFPQAVTCQVQPFIGTTNDEPWSLSFTMLAPPAPTVSASGWLEWGDRQFIGGEVTWSTQYATSCTVVTEDGDTIGTGLGGTWYPPAFGSPFRSVTVSAWGPGGSASHSFPIDQRG